MVLSFADFTAYDLPREKWLKLVNPKMRLRVRGKRCKFVSPVAKVDSRRPDAETDMESCTHWPWNDDGRFTRPSFADDELFEIVIERRFLLGYKCIRRTKSVPIDQVCPRDRDYFTAYELPAKKWMNLVRPRMRLRVRLPFQNCDFVSSSVKVGDRSRSADVSDFSFSSVGWPWSDDERFPQPCFSDDDVFEVEVERRFLLWYKCIRRTKPATIDQVRTGDHCALSLYDGRQFADVPEERIEIGEITFTLRSDATSEGASSEGKASFTRYS